MALKQCCSHRVCHDWLNIHLTSEQRLVSVVKHQIHNCTPSFYTLGIGTGVFLCLLPIAKNNLDNFGWKTGALHPTWKLLWKLPTSTTGKRNPEKCVHNWIQSIYQTIYGENTYLANIHADIIYIQFRKAKGYTDIAKLLCRCYKSGISEQRNKP